MKLLEFETSEVDPLQGLEAERELQLPSQPYGVRWLRGPFSYRQARWLTRQQPWLQADFPGSPQTVSSGQTQPQPGFSDVLGSRRIL